VIDLLGRDLVVVTGKGGVGKTTVAVALGLGAAARGLRVVVAEVAARDEVSRALSGSPARVFDERSVADGLHHVSIDPQHAVEEYLEDQLPSRALADALARSRLFTYFAAATPGMRELVTIGKVWELAQERRRTPGARPYDLVVLDAPATGHGVAVLSAPRTFSEVARIGPIARQGRTIHEMLVDPARTAVLAVASPEEMPVNETMTLCTSLRDELGIGLAAVAVKGMLPDRLTAADAERVAACAPRSAAARTALSHHRRSRVQRAQLGRLKRGLPDGVAVRTLPHLFRDRLREADYRTLARRLEAIR
jgi:anion-transporting  ArsA/GET3 family ATPase